MLNQTNKQEQQQSSNSSSSNNYRRELRHIIDIKLNRREERRRKLESYDESHYARKCINVTSGGFVDYDGAAAVVYSDDGGSESRGPVGVGARRDNQRVQSSGTQRRHDQDVRQKAVAL